MYGIKEQNKKKEEEKDSGGPEFTLRREEESFIHFVQLLNRKKNAVRTGPSNDGFTREAFGTGPE